jgi:hypothetical protein
MRSPVVVLSILAVLVAPPIRADSPQIPQRFHATARWGTFEDMDSPVLLRKDGEPGNPVLGWAGSQQAGAALGLEILPGLTLDVGYYRLEFDLGSDVVLAEPGGAFETVRIATGNFEDLRFALWVSLDAFKDDAQYFVSPARPGRARFSAVFLAGFTEPSEVLVDDAARELLGIADVEAGTSTSLGFGGRFDYRLGRSRLVAGAEVDWLYSASGDSLTVTTAPGSPYSGTVAEHEGVSFVLDLSYYF